MRSTKSVSVARGGSLWEEWRTEHYWEDDEFQDKRTQVTKKELYQKKSNRKETGHWEGKVQLQDSGL